MIDSHAHIYLPQVCEDIEEILNRAVQNDVSAILMPSIDRESEMQMDSLINSDTAKSLSIRLRLYKMAGIHPCDVMAVPDEIELFEWCSKSDVIAVGETGLDYYWSKDYIPQQKESLRLHCKISKETGKPVVLHNRESTSDLLDIIEDEQDGRLTGVWHCFTGSLDEGQRAIDLGFILGVGGVITFKNAGVDKTLSKLDLNCMILETDSPYLAPVPYRGKRNEPAYLPLIAKKLAETKGITIEETSHITRKNTIKLFKLDL